MNNSSYYFATFIGIISGTIIGFNLSLSLTLFNLLKRGFYEFEIDFDISVSMMWYFYGLIGGLITAVISFCLINNHVKFYRITIFLIVASMITILLSNYLDMKLRPPLVKAVQYNYNSKVEKTIQRNDNLNLQDIHGRTALSEASIYSFDPTIPKMLIEAGANVNIPNDNGETALIRAFYTVSDKTEIIKLLVEAGADVNVIDNQGNTPLLMAIESSDENKEIVKLLIKAGANINSLYERNNTPLMIAAKSSYDKAEIIKLLIEAGANVNATNNQGESALSLAKKYGHPNNASVLQEYNTKN